MATITGTSSLTLKKLSLKATGIQIISAISDITLLKLELYTYGIVLNNIGVTALTLPKFEIVSTGTQFHRVATSSINLTKCQLSASAFKTDIIGTSEITLPKITVETIGRDTYLKATSEINLTICQFSSNGIVTKLGTGEITLPIIQLDVTAFVYKEAISEITLPILNIESEGYLIRYVTSSIILPKLEVLTNGYLNHFGQSTLTLPKLSFHSTGSRINTKAGTSELMLPKFRLASDGALNLITYTVGDEIGTDFATMDLFIAARHLDTNRSNTWKAIICGNVTCNSFGSDGFGPRYLLPRTIFQARDRWIDTWTTTTNTNFLFAGPFGSDPTVTPIFDGILFKAGFVAGKQIDLTVISTAKNCKFQAIDNLTFSRQFEIYAKTFINCLAEYYWNEITVKPTLVVIGALESIINCAIDVGNSTISTMLSTGATNQNGLIVNSYAKTLEGINKYNSYTNSTYSGIPSQGRLERKSNRIGILPYAPAFDALGESTKYSIGPLNAAYFSSLSLTLPKLQVISTGIEIATGTSELTLPLIELNCTAWTYLKAEGFLTLPSIQFECNGLKHDYWSGTAILTLPSIQFESTGLKHDYWHGTSELTLPSISFNSLGCKYISSQTISLTLPSISLNATAIFSNSGEASITLPSISCISSGYLIRYINGNISLPIITTQSEGEVRHIGSSNIVLPFISYECIGRVARIWISPVSLNIPIIQLNSIGHRLKYTSLDLTLPSITLTSVANIPLPGGVETAAWEHFKDYLTNDSMLNRFVKTWSYSREIEILREIDCPFLLVYAITTNNEEYLSPLKKLVNLEITFKGQIWNGSQSMRRRLIYAFDEMIKQSVESYNLMNPDITIIKVDQSNFTQKSIYIEVIETKFILRTNKFNIGSRTGIV